MTASVDKALKTKGKKFEDFSLDMIILKLAAFIWLTIGSIVGL